MKINVFAAMAIMMVLVGIYLINAQENIGVYSISGIIYQNNTLDLNPIYHLEERSAEDEQFLNSDYQVKFLDVNLNVLKIYKFPVFGLANVDEPIKAFAFAVGIPKSTKKIVIEYNTNPLKERSVTKNAPVIEDIVINKIADEIYDIEWDSYDLDNDDLEYVVYYANYNGEIIDILNFNIKGIYYKLDTSKLAGGDVFIRVLATDGFNQFYKDSDIFHVSTKSPITHIMTPIEDSEYIQGSDITLEGFAYDPEDSFIEAPDLLIWEIDDDIAGYGSYLTVNNLALGEHAITLTATDTEGKSSSATVDIAVTTETKPDVKIKELKTYPAELRETEQGMEDISIQAALFNVRSDALCDISFYGDKSIILPEEKYGGDLALYLPFDEGSGSIAYDKIGNNQGTIHGNAKWKYGSECKSGGCLSFDGYDDYVSVPDSGLHFLTDGSLTAFTILAWIKTSDTRSSGEAIISKTSPGGYNDLDFAVASPQNGKLRFHYGSSEGRDYYSNTPSNNDNNWRLVGIQRDTSGKFRFIRDGSFDGEFVDSTNTPNHNFEFRIGEFGRGSAAGYKFSGLMDEVKIYNRALSADEITQLYQTGIIKPDITEKGIKLLKSEKVYLPANEPGYIYESFTLTKPGNYKLSVEVSNCEPGESSISNNEADVSFKVIPYGDDTPPITNLMISQPKYESNENKFITSNTNLTLESTDYPAESATGVKSTYYCADKTNECSPAISYNNQITIAEEGANYLRYYSEDNAGNIEETKSAKLIVDKTPPITGSDYQSDGVWVNKDALITLTASDSLSGVKETLYCIGENCIPEITYAEPISITIEGIAYLRYSSLDNLGNKENIKEATIKIDKTAPTLSLTLNPNTIWPPNKKEVDVKVEGYAADSLSDVKETKFELIDEYNEVSAIVNNFNDIIKLIAWRDGNDNDGRNYTITAESTDNAGNTAVTSAAVVVQHDQGK